jgi:phosphopantothenoylcysteine decarboxylase/phosphopantothenate--cysteine ligase
LNFFSGKNILIGVTGGISAYKVPLLLREFKEKGATVKIILTNNAKKFVSPLVLSALSDGVFDSLWEASIPHISLSGETDLFIVLPADYNIIGKVVSGIADDLLTSSISAYDKEILFFPSMNEKMYGNPVFQRNIGLLKECGHKVVDPSVGSLACGSVGKGRLPSIERIVLEAERTLAPDIFSDDLCLITGGGTAEKIDPVRYLTNSSSGKMAYALSRACYIAGGRVELVLGINTIRPDADIPYRISRVESAQDMYNEVLGRWNEVRYLFMNAAVSDFTVGKKSNKKIKKSKDLTLKLEENIDILKKLKKNKKKQFIVGFSLETDDLEVSTTKKMKDKGCDLMVGNYPDSIGSDNSSGVIMSPSGKEEFKCSKDELAWKIIEKVKS